MEYKRTIRFQYYRILCKKRKENGEWGNFETFDLVKWIEHMDNSKKIQTRIEFNKTSATIDCFSYDDVSDLWGMRFMKLRDTNIPTKVKERQESEAFELGDDEYIGEDVTLLYEKKSSLSMIQANRFSLGVSRLEEFFNFTNNNENIRIYIQPICAINNLSKLKKCNYKHIDISFANLGSWNSQTGAQSLSSLIAPIRKIGGVTGHITIGLGHTKLDALDRLESNNIVEDILSNKRFIRSAKVKVRDDDDTDVEIIDLFEDIYHDFITFTLTSKTALEYRDAILSMIYFFKKRRKDLYMSIGYKNGDD